MGTETSKLGLYKPAYGEAGEDWWDKINGNFDALDAALGYQVVSSAATLSPFTCVLADTSGDALELTLPALPAAGTVIRVRDYAGSFAAHNLTLARNGKKISGAESNLVLSANWQVVTLVYSGDTDGWLYDTLVADAVSKRHTQNADTKLDEGGANEVTAAEMKALVAGATRNTADPTPDTDHTVEGRIHPGTAGEALSFGQLVYLKSDGKWWKTDASAEATTKGMLRVVASSSIDADGTGNFAMPGSYIRDDDWNWSTGAPLFLDAATAGGLTETAPSGGNFVRVAGHAQTEDIFHFAPSPDWYESEAEE